jgi:hypothetical protein
MTSKLEAFLFRVCAWIIARQYLPQELARAIVHEFAWRDGYMGACIDLHEGEACHLDYTERLGLSNNAFFYPWIPCAPAVTCDMMLFWNGGYERAILLHRIGIDPFLYIHNPRLSNRVCIETVASYILQGALRIDPRTHRNRFGKFLQASIGQENDLNYAYSKFAETVEQIRGKWHEAVIEERCAGLADGSPHS